MGGRKGYSLKKVVGDERRIRAEKEELLEGIKEKDPKKVAKASARILAKSDSALDSLVHSFLFVGSLKKSECKKISKQTAKERRKELSKKWASYRSKKGKKFDSTTNREVVDSAARVLGGPK